MIPLFVLDRQLVVCACGFRWFSADADASARAIEVHVSTCVHSAHGVARRAAALGFGASLLIDVTPIRVWAQSLDEKAHCRMNEPPQVPRPSRADRDGRCSWNCRGSYSSNCFCPCQGARHGENHRWDPDERVAVVHLDRKEPDIMDQLIARTPEGEVPRKPRRST